MKEILASQMVKVGCRKHAELFIVANPGSCGSRTLWAAILAGVPLLSAKAFVEKQGSCITHCPAINTQRQAFSWSYIEGAGSSRVAPEPSPGQLNSLESSRGFCGSFRPEEAGSCRPGLGVLGNYSVTPPPFGKDPSGVPYD